MSNPSTTLRVLILLFTPIGWFMAAGYQAAKTIRDMRYKPIHKEDK